MKFLIWFLCFIVNALITTLIKETGVILGAIPTVILYGATIWLARTLCKKWDEYKENRKTVRKTHIKPAPQPTPVKAIAPQIVPVKTNASDPILQNPVSVNDRICFCRKCGSKLMGEANFCNKCGTKIEQISNPLVVEPAPIMAPITVSTAMQNSTCSSFDTEKIMNAKDPVKALMEEQTKETIRAMEANYTAQCDNEDDPEFGLVPEKPIYTLATDIVEGQKAYLNKLRTINGEKITWKRLGSTSAAGIHGMIDIYATFLPSGKPYKTLFINMYGAKKSLGVPQGFAISNDIPKTLNSAAKVSTSKPVPVQEKTVYAKSTSKVGFWITIVLLAAALGISLFFNYSQYSQVISLQNQVAEMQRIEENSNDYKKLLSAMENVNGMNYRIIGGLIDRIPAGYEDTSEIRTQYNELKKYISTIESSTLTTRSCDALRTAYVNLNSFNNKYHNWDVSDYLMNVIYSTHFKKLIFGREWTDGTYNLHWYEDGSGERLSTNLPNDKKSWKNYYFVSKKIDNDHIIGYVNVDDTSDRFDAFKIVDVIYSDGTWSLSVYCYSNGHTYTLK